MDAVSSPAAPAVEKLSHLDLDHLNVLLDLLGDAERDATVAKRHADGYESLPDDPKADAEGWTRLAAETRDFLMDAVTAGSDLHATGYLYSRPEIVNGTGFRRGTRFADVGPR